MDKKSYDLRMNWSRLKKQLIWSVGTAMDEEAPYSDLVKLLAGQAYYYLMVETYKLTEPTKEFAEMAKLAGEILSEVDGVQMTFDDSLNEHSCDEPFPAYTLGRDPNTLDVTHID